jgi:CheY-like chemotaxis protein
MACSKRNSGREHQCGENGTLREIDQALRAGCVSVLVKPCLPNVLLAEIRRVLALPGVPAA